MLWRRGVRIPSQASDRSGSKARLPGPHARGSVHGGNIIAGTVQKRNFTLPRIHDGSSCALGPRQLGLPTLVNWPEPRVNGTLGAVDLDFK